MKKSVILLSLWLIICLLTGCLGKPQNISVGGHVYFGGEPGTALPDPGIASLNSYYDSFSLKSTALPSEPPVSLIVSCDPHAPPEEQQRILKELGFTIKRQLFYDHNSYVISPGSMSIDEAYALAKNSSLVKTVEYNYNVMKQSVTPNDTFYDLQWDLRVTKFNVVWDNFKGQNQVTIAVLDTGLNTASTEFTNRLAPAGDWYDFADNDADPRDNVYYNDDTRYSHGTNVAGIIGAIPDNGYGYAGAAWSSAVKILPVRVLDKTGSGSFAAIVDGIYWAVLHNAKIINLSLGASGNNDSMLLNNAVNYAYSKGVTIVCAAGNENTAINYPARLSAIYPNVIAVGATGYSNRKAYYSCFGPELTVMAPGGDNQISGISNEQKYIWNITFDKDPDSSTPGEVLNCGFIGTSQATPHVSALAALLYSYGVTSPVKIKDIIAQTATDLGSQGWDSRYGNGLINAFAALTATTNDLTNVTIGIRNRETKNNLVAPINPGYNGAFFFPNVPKGDWELYGEYNGLNNGYKYYGSTPITVKKSITQELSLQLIPENQ